MCDAIIAYVDGTDKNWIENYNKFVKNPLENVESRFRSYDVLDIQVKLIRKFMPFIDKIFIVVSNLSQLDHIIDELKKLDKVFIVTHEEIIPKRYLPCFNSCTIEMYLHNIKKLDEKFLYFNDDIFPINETKESDFFNGGNICMKPGLKYFDEEICSVYEHNVINSTKLLYKDTKIYGKYNAIKPVHSVMPMFKSVNKNVWLEYHNEIEKSLTRTRHRKNINAYVFLNYLYQKKKYTSKQVECSYFSIFNDFKDINKSIKKSKVICINDKSEYYIDFDEWKQELRRFLECILEDKEYIAPIKESKIILDDTPLKVALCAIAKNENLYIREWVEWYKNIGISKIFLYDNNDIDGERFEEVINDYIESEFVKVINKRGIIKTINTDKTGESLQGICYQDCYYNNYKYFDWICFFDIDEFLEIYSKYNNLYEFLNDFNHYDGIRVQWKMYGDNENLYYENKSLFKRFKKENNSSYDKHVKQILNCNKYFDEELIFCAHGVFNKKYNFVNVNKDSVKNVYMDIIAYENLPIYLNHFYCKSTEEFFKRKYNKTSAVTGVNNTRNFNIEFLKKQYFEHNKRTEEKERFIDIFVNSNNSVNVYMASLYKDGHVIESIKSIIKQPQVKTLTLSANNYTDEQYKNVVETINSSKLIIHRTNNEKLSFEKLRFVNEDRSTKYVAFCDDDLIFYDGYFRKMISECELLDVVVSYHGGIFKKFPIDHYYPDRKSFSFNKEVKENKNVDIIGNGVSLFKRDWITYKQWKDLYENAPEVSMDDITVSYILRKNGHKLVVVKHSIGDVIERKNNSDTVYNIYKKNDSVQTDWVNKYFVNL